MQINNAAKTHTGQLREHNEDSIICKTPPFTQDAQDAMKLWGYLAVVADGMGGYEAGDLASQTCVRTIEEAYYNYDTSYNPLERLVASIHHANEAIYTLTASGKYSEGIGTTVAAIALVEEENGNLVANIAHVGDSRIYVLRDKTLHALTTDHSLVEEQRQSGEISDYEAANADYKNVITRGLGHEPEVEVDAAKYQINAGDVLMLCSDGLTNEVPEEEIQEVLLQYSPNDAVNELIRRANQYGGRDNISCVVLDLRKEVGFKALITKPVKKIMALIAAGAIGLFLLIGWVAGLFNPEDIVVPGLTKMSVKDATESLEKLGLKSEKREDEYSADVDFGLVVRTDPAAGRKVQKGAKITLVISLGPEPPHIVPDLKGMSLEAAIALLEENGLKNYKTVEEYSVGPAGYVFKHVPGSGQQVRSQDIIILYVSVRIQMVSVPNVTGKSRSEAEKILRNEELVVGGVTADYAPNIPEGSVISQNPVVGSKEPRGTKINLVISLGPEPLLTVPDLKGKSQSEAEKIIRIAGLEVGGVTENYDPNIPEGSVISQNPVVGSKEPRGTKINLVISLGPETTQVENVLVPNLKGKNYEDAKTSLTNLNLGLEVTKVEESSSVPAGFVIRTSPEEGSVITRGSKVIVYISKAE